MAGFGGFGGGSTFGSTAQSSPHNPNGDYEVSPGVLKDSVSSLAFAPTNNFLVAGTWDNQVMLWDVQHQGSNIQAQAKAAIKHQAPVTDVCWSKDGTKVFSSSCDNTAKMWTPGQNQGVQIAQHAAPVIAVRYIEELAQSVVTASWDKTVKYNDLRTPGKVVMQYQLNERVYAMDVSYPLMVVALGGPQREIKIYDLRKPQNAFRTMTSPLKFQSCCISCFTDKTGYAVGSIEGRVAIQLIEDKVDPSKSFAFKCHRQNADVYPVNSIAFHPQYGTFATAGADGCFNFWDKDSKQRLKFFKKCNQPITATAWNATGQLFAYSVSYDWHKGREYHNPATAKSHILIHQTPEAEIKPRQKK